MEIRHAGGAQRRQYARRTPVADRVPKPDLNPHLAAATVADRSEGVIRTLTRRAVAGCRSLALTDCSLRQVCTTWPPSGTGKPGIDRMAGMRNAPLPAGTLEGGHRIGDHLGPGDRSERRRPPAADPRAGEQCRRASARIADACWATWKMRRPTRPGGGVRNPAAPIGNGRYTVAGSLCAQPHGALRHGLAAARGQVGEPFDQIVDLIRIAQWPVRLRRSTLPPRRNHRDLNPRFR